VAAIVVLVVVTIAIVVVLASVPVVTVTQIDFTSVDNACGANNSDVGAGFTVRATASAAVSVTVLNTGANYSCTIASLTPTTPGFSITGANLPLTVAPQEGLSLNFTVHGPAGGFYGVLVVDVE
jgi:hypothetical protein